MKVEMIQCDNPRCGKLTHDAYNWLSAEVLYIGTGPKVEVTVCSTKCLSPGVEAAFERHEYEEAEREISYRYAMEQAVSDRSCEVCAAPPGEKCRTRNGNPSQKAHEPRVKAARAALIAAAKEE